MNKKNTTWTTKTSIGHGFLKDGSIFFSETVGFCTIISEDNRHILFLNYVIVQRKLLYTHLIGLKNTCKLLNCPLAVNRRI
jgi:hypothetical protein